MTDVEGMKILRDWVLNGSDDWPGGSNGEFRKWLLPHFKRIFCQPGNKIIKDLIDNGYLPDEHKLNVEEQKILKEKTIQARRQYVYDCLKAGEMLDLNPGSGVK